MKTIGTILAVLLGIIVLLGVGLQMFLTKGLTSALNKGVFPAVKTLYGLDMSIENASINVLKGTAELQGFKTRNLQGYKKPVLLSFNECRLELDMMSLLNRDPIIITEAKAVGAMMVIERNEEKKINVRELADALKPVESANEEPAPQPAPSEKKVAAPVHIRQIIADVQVLYVDSRNNREYPLELKLTANNLFTVPEAGQPTSLIVLRGAMADDDNSFVTDLSAMVEPLTDPEKPSFTATGSILDIDADFLDELLASNDMKSGPFSIRPSIRCRQGQLEGSSIDLILKNLEIYNAVIGETKIGLPVGGTLIRPSIDLPGALSSLISEQAFNIGKAFGLKELKKGLADEIGVELADSPQETLMGALTNTVKEIEAGPALQELIQQVAPGAQPTNSATTNRPTKEVLGDALIEQLEQNVNELKENEAVKDLLRGFFK